MAAVAILVNGLPGSGKTTLAAGLAEVLGCPLLSKDAVKEPLADIAGPMITSRALGGVAMDTVWGMAAAVEAGVVLDAVWLRTRDREHLVTGLARAGSPRFVEVWCDVDRTVAEERLRDRYDPGSPLRHPTHGDLEDVLAFWDEHAAAAGPVGLGPVVRVDTGAALDVAQLVLEISRHFGA
ncbi:ATP-binding protein [Curtobacterium sp. MCBD17_035]|uniref:AAA family ATPase n=1 Tax=Curtobacterium sp. MCBD17_035 TaxID=2175673 RepID=UPI001C64A451|nr:ATP-binding protein [Curtobacterium sp. MCBD17_035]WIB67090.1 ATP-binding protein [Curtobacterium sp. MCBD17_035]